MNKAQVIVLIDNLVILTNINLGNEYCVHIDCLQSANIGNVITDNIQSILLHISGQYCLNIDCQYSANNDRILNLTVLC